ncbi:phasin family protein [Halomonas sediminis]
MKNTAEKASQQFESAMISPMRSYAVAALNYYDQLLNAQIDAMRAYTDMSMEQARTWLDVKDTDSIKKAMESQQKIAANLTERMKGDAEKVISMSQDFAQQSQEMTEENSKKANNVVATQ